MTEPTNREVLAPGSGEGDGAPRLEVRLLGGFAVACQGQMVAPDAWGRRGARQLVKLLASSSRQRLHREEFLETLWPDHDPTAAAGAFRAMLHVARRALATIPTPGVDLLVRDGDEIVLQSPGLAWVDAHAFEASAIAAHRSADPVALERAIDLYAGDLLPEDRYEDWTSVWRESLREQYLSLHLALGDAYAAGDDHVRAAAILERAFRLDPLNEDIAARLMQQVALTGSRQRALRVYQRLRAALNAELDVAPAAATERLYAEILAGHVPIRPGQPAPARKAAVASNLPEPLTRFIGREAAVERVGKVLVSRPLVTLTGVGGVGKTRLAIAAARSVLDAFPDGAWFADLSAVRSDEAVRPAIMMALAASSFGGDDWSAVAGALRERRALLVIDNCEHVISEVADAVQDLLRPGSLARVLTTSREPLRVDGETVLRVPPLTVAGSGAVADDGGESESASLFIERARHHDPDFNPTPEDRATIDAMCRQLDGLPLAIELAAARVTVLTVEQIRQRLDDPFRVLGSGSRAGSSRHQTLSKTIEWSYDLLDPAERVVFERLSVFDGGFSLDAAESVCEGEGIDRRDVLSLVAQLVDKSLVQVEATPDDVRYRLLETVRHFAAGRLHEHGEHDTLAMRHALYYLNLAEAAKAGLNGREQERWLRRLEHDIDNIRGALRTLVSRQNVEGELRLASAIQRFWWVRGHVSEGRRWLEDALARAQAKPGAPATVIAGAMQSAGNLAVSQGDAIRGQELLEEALALYRQHGDDSQIADALTYLATVLRLRGEDARAIPLAEESLVLRRRLGDPRDIALTLGVLGELGIVASDLTSASDYLLEALDIYRAIGDRHSVAITLNNLGEAARGLGELDRAAAYCQESLAIFRELDAPHGVAYLLSSLADIAREQGRAGDARRDYREALATFRKLGYTAAALGVIRGIALLDIADGAVARGVTMLAAAGRLLDATGASWTTIEHDDNARGIELARRSIDENAYEIAAERGASLSFDDLAALALSDVPASGSSRTATLSPREREVVAFIVRGLSNRQIAAEMGVAQRTIDTHVANILRKLGVSSRQQIGEAGAVDAEG